MTTTEIQAKTSEKIEKIKALCAELQVSMSAEEVVIPKSGVITKVIYFSDNEKYPQDEVKAEETTEAEADI